VNNACLQSSWRAPYTCAFGAGNFDFLAIATHSAGATASKCAWPSWNCFPDWIYTSFRKRYAEDHDLLVMGRARASSERAADQRKQQLFADIQTSRSPQELLPAPGAVTILVRRPAGS
jgi:hypothetical protein